MCYYDRTVNEEFAPYDYDSVLSDKAQKAILKYFSDKQKDLERLTGEWLDCGVNELRKSLKECINDIRFQMKGAMDVLDKADIYVRYNWPYNRGKWFFVTPDDCELADDYMFQNAE